MKWKAKGISEHLKWYKRLYQIRKSFRLKKKNIFFKRWGNLFEEDNPEAVVFFAIPDVLSGLFTLANFDQTEPNATYTPFGAGCSLIVHYPYLEKNSESERAVIGLFDPSARPYVTGNMLTFALPVKKLK